jgi:hypothetical protein
MRPGLVDFFSSGMRQGLVDFSVAERVKRFD